MDYPTHSISRMELRQLAPIFLFLFGVKETGPFPVLHALEILPDFFRL